MVMEVIRKLNLRAGCGSRLASVRRARTGVKLNSRRNFVALATKKASKVSSNSNGSSSKPFIIQQQGQQVQNLQFKFNNQDQGLGLNQQKGGGKEIVHQDFYMPTRFRYVYDKERDLVGQGFFAKVYRAKDIMLGKNVALKIIDKSRCPKEVYEQEVEIYNEMRGMKRDEKEGLGMCYEVQETRGQVMMVFDFYNSGDLFDEIVDNGPLEEAEARVLMGRLLNTVANLHENQILHRDIKLENILLNLEENENDKESEKGRFEYTDGEEEMSRDEKLRTAKLTDFGYARKLYGRDQFKNPAGTFGYVAPEVLSNRLYTPACDMWSVGTVLFTCIAGYQPFPYKESAPNPQALVSSMSQSETLVTKELEAIKYGTKQNVWNTEMAKPAFNNCSDDLKNLLKQMLDPNPKTRISAVDALSHAWFTESEEQEA